MGVSVCVYWWLWLSCWLLLPLSTWSTVGRHRREEVRVCVVVVTGQGWCWMKWTHGSERCGQEHHPTQIGGRLAAKQTCKLLQWNLKLYPGQPSGYYCDMDRVYGCNSTGRWMRIAHLNMSDVLHTVSRRMETHLNSEEDVWTKNKSKRWMWFCGISHPWTTIQSCVWASHGIPVWNS